MDKREVPPRYLILLHIDSAASHSPSAPAHRLSIYAASTPRSMAHQALGLEVLHRAKLGGMNPYDPPGIFNTGLDILNISH